MEGDVLSFGFLDSFYVAVACEVLGDVLPIQPLAELLGWEGRHLHHLGKPALENLRGIGDVVQSVAANHFQA